jgi:hypothetical protein
VRSAPLLECITRPVSVAEVVRAAQADPHLRRTYARSEQIVLELLERDAAGELRVSPRPIGKALSSYYETGRANGDRSLAYVATYERNWPEHRELYDFVEARDANAARKAFQRDNYLAHLGPHLDRLRPGAAVLDAGCGVGRLTGALLARGLSVSASRRLGRGAQMRSARRVAAAGRRSKRSTCASATCVTWPASATRVRGVDCPRGHLLSGRIRGFRCASSCA